MRIPTLVELNKTFEFFKESLYLGVPGVIRVTSKQHGPTVGMTFCTHGNEPCGLAAAQALLDMFEQETELKRGNLYLVLNNLEATNRYFAAVTDSERQSARLIDINLNRLPENTPELSGDKRYEIKRAQELQPIWRQFDVALDIHSTTQDNGSMLVSVGNDFPLSLMSGFPVEKLVSNIAHIQIGRPVASFYGKPVAHARAFGIECGAHEAPSSFARAINSACALLQNLNMLPGEAHRVCDEYAEYFVNGSVVFPNKSYELTQLFKNFEFVPKGTVLARGDGQDIMITTDCHTLFASKVKPDHLDEEVMFLSEPVRLRKII